VERSALTSHPIRNTVADVMIPVFLVPSVPVAIVFAHRELKIVAEGVRLDWIAIRTTAESAETSVLRMRPASLATVSVLRERSLVGIPVLTFRPTWNIADPVAMTALWGRLVFRGFASVHKERWRAMMSVRISRRIRTIAAIAAGPVQLMRLVFPVSVSVQTEWIVVVIVV